jgi:hypothetical protein
MSLPDAQASSLLLSSKALLPVPRTVDARIHLGVLELAELAHLRLAPARALERHRRLVHEHAHVRAPRASRRAVLVFVHDAVEALREEARGEGHERAREPLARGVRVRRVERHARPEEPERGEHGDDPASAGQPARTRERGALGRVRYVQVLVREVRVERAAEREGRRVGVKRVINARLITHGPVGQPREELVHVADTLHRPERVAVSARVPSAGGLRRRGRKCAPCAVELKRSQPRSLTSRRDAPAFSTSPWYSNWAHSSLVNSAQNGLGAWRSCVSMGQTLIRFQTSSAFSFAPGAHALSRFAIGRA